MWTANTPTPRLKNVGDEVPDPTPAYAVAAGLAALALLGLAGAVWSARKTVRRQTREAELVEQLREAREQAQALAQLLDVWQWKTDADHRLIEMRPPEGADADLWSKLPTASTRKASFPFLWETFHAGSLGNRSLRAKLDARAAIDQSARRLDLAPQSGADAESAFGVEAQAEVRPAWRLRGVPRFDAQGRFMGYLGTAREAQPQLPSLHAADRRDAGDTDHPSTLPPDTAQMKADSEAFSYTVSHDLRAPIRVVEGFTKILKEDYGRQLDRIGNDHLDRVLGAAARMNSMIDALLALAQLQATPLVRQPINLSQLAHFIIDDLRRQSPEREVTVHIEPNLHARGDPTLLRIVLENLLGNAWKYTSKRRLGQIWFESEKNEQGGASYIIRDNGAGFDMRFADRLFGVFQRLHSANDFQGTGVGLASVRRIIRRHDGEIWADSEPDRGARFHFTLPQRLH